MPQDRNQLTLYKELLGKEFQHLPKSIQQFHDHYPAKAKGFFDISHGKGFAAKFINFLIRTPKPGKKVPVSLKVSSLKNNKEIWERSFSGMKKKSIQYFLKPNHFIEKAGPLFFTFEVKVESKKLEFYSKELCFFKIPLPKFISPKVRTSVTGNDKTWHTHLVIELPWLGKIIEYQGEIKSL